VSATFRKLHSAAGFIAGILIGLSIATPVFAATSPSLEEWNGPLGLVALVLLGIGMLINAAALGDAWRYRNVQVQHVRLPEDEPATR